MAIAITRPPSVLLLYTLEATQLVLTSQVLEGFFLALRKYYHPIAPSQYPEHDKIDFA